MREDFLKLALSFLGSQKVIGASLPDDQKREFLKQKGGTDEEIEEAFRRFNAQSGGAAPGTSPQEAAQGLAQSLTEISAPKPATPAQQVQPQAPRPQPFAPVTPSPSLQQYSPPPPQQPGPPSYGGYGGMGSGPPAYGGYGGPMVAPPYYGGDYGGYGGFGFPAAQQPFQQPAPRYDSSASSGAWLPWMLGGVVAGLGATAVGLGLTSQQPPYPPHQQQHPHQLQQQALSSQPVAQPQAATQSAPSVGQVAPEQLAGTGGTAAANGGSATSGSASEELKEKVALEDLLATVRQQSEEARENSAVFAKALKQQQEQYEKLFEDMQKVLKLQAESMKPPSTKPQPTDLSAATLQQLASLFKPLQAEQTNAGDAGAPRPAPLAPLPAAEPTNALSAPTSAGGAAVASVAPVTMAPVIEEPTGASGAGVAAQLMPASPAGPMTSGDLRETLDAIGQALSRLTRDSATKAELGKSLNNLAMLLQNLVNFPDKNRKINASSQRFHNLIGVPGTPGAEILRLSGFAWQEPNFTLPADQGTEAAQRVLDFVQDHQRNLDQAWASRPTDVNSSFGPAVSELAPSIATQGVAGSSSSMAEAASSSMRAPSSAATGPTSVVQANVPGVALGAAPGSTGALDPGTGSTASSVPSLGARAAMPASASSAGRPWEARAATPGMGSGLPWQTSVLQQQRPASAIRQDLPSMGSADGGTGGEEASMSASASTALIGPAMGGNPSAGAAGGSSVLAQAANVAHPAESQEWGPGPVMAHPAESEAAPQLSASTPAPAAPQLAIAHPAESPDAESHGSAAAGSASTSGVVAPAPAMAHPAERSTPSEEPQSGG